MTAPPESWRLAALSLTALGVVYGDIGTSPLYALRECFKPEYGLTPTPASVYGVLSLIVWALILVVSVKYLVFIMRADNRGEGGILALLASITRTRPPYLLLGRARILSVGRAPMQHWRKLLFGFMVRNARAATEYFRIPPDRVVELGARIEF